MRQREKQKARMQFVLNKPSPNNHAIFDFVPNSQSFFARRRENISGYIKVVKKVFNEMELQMPVVNG